MSQLSRATEKIVLEAYGESKQPWVIAYSGGKDSSVVLDLFLRAARKFKSGPQIYVVSNNTRVESPLVSDQLDEMHKVLKAYVYKENLNVSVNLTMPPLSDSFWTNLIGKGYPPPTQMFRWCTSRLKIDPTSRFIDSKLGNRGAVIAVGTRSAESASRSNQIRKHQISEYFSNHTSRQDTQLFMPIRHWSDEDVWEYLAATEPPWGGDYMDLINLYREAYGGECPVVSDASALRQPSCGERSPRFGCWTCTLVETDFSLQGLIDTGHENLRPLYEFRNWLVTARKDNQNRLPINRKGQVRYKNGALVFGPFRMEFRKEILERLLLVQQSYGKELVSREEISYIEQSWEDDELLLSLYEGKKIPMYEDNLNVFVTC